MDDFKEKRARSMEYDFKGKRVLVTGAGKGESGNLCNVGWVIRQTWFSLLSVDAGIGRATVRALAQNGAEVIALSRTAADLESLKEEVWLTWM